MMVMMKDTNNVTINNTYDSAVVEKVVDGINEDGEICKKVTFVTQAGQFVTYPVDTAISLNSLKTSGAQLCPGDIVRYNVSGGEINGIVVDFDASPQVMGKNNASNAPFKRRFYEFPISERKAVFPAGNAGLFHASAGKQCHRAGTV